MKITISSKSGDWEEMLYSEDKVIYEITTPEIIDFFSRLSEAYNEGEDDLEEYCECLYNLINYGYLYSDDSYKNSKQIDDDYDDYDDFLDDEDFGYEENLRVDDDEENTINNLIIVKKTTEYYVDNINVSKDDYDKVWKERIGMNGSKNWDEEGLKISVTDTKEIIFEGKI